MAYDPPNGTYLDTEKHVIFPWMQSYPFQKLKSENLKMRSKKEVFAKEIHEDVSTKSDDKITIQYHLWVFFSSSFQTPLKHVTILWQNMFALHKHSTWLSEDAS